MPPAEPARRLRRSSLIVLRPGSRLCLLRWHRLASALAAAGEAAEMKASQAPASCYSSAMAKASGKIFSRRAPDIITEELVAAFAAKASFEFKPVAARLMA